MAKLYNLKSAYELVNSLYGIAPDPDVFEDIALAGWEQIGNKHTRLYKFVGNTTNQELQLPCNADIVESVTIPISDANMTSNKTDLLDFESVMVESYIEPGNQKIGEHIYGKSITDPCLGWNESEQLIYTIAEMNQ